MQLNVTQGIVCKNFFLHSLLKNTHYKCIPTARMHQRPVRDEDNNHASKNEHRRCCKELQRKHSNLEEKQH